MNRMNKTRVKVFALSGLLAASFAAPASAEVDGKALFDRSCSVCHSIAPPPKSAPPILPIAARYRQHFASRDEGVRQMAEFIVAPKKEKVLADEHAITRFGLMPPIPLSKEEASAVAGWIWDQNSTGTWGPGKGRGGGQGSCNQR